MRYPRTVTAAYYILKKELDFDEKEKLNITAAAYINSSFRSKDFFIISKESNCYHYKE